MEVSAKPVPEAFRFEQNGLLLRKMMESAALGMALIGADRRLVFVNNALRDALGYGRESCADLDVDAILLPEDSAFGLQLMRLIAGETDVHQAECRFRRKDGSPVWMLASASAVRGERASRRPLFVLLQFTNIERQKHADAARTYAERRWSAALAAAGQGVWDHDVRNDDMYYSDTWRTMRGIPVGEYIPPSQELWLARLHPDDRERIKAVVGKQDLGEDGFDTLEYRERHRDGHYMWILSRGRPVEWDAEGHPVRTIGTDTDITRLKTAEAELAAEKERLRVTLECIGDGVISTDARSCITFMNAIAEQMTGWRSSSAIGRNVDEVFAIVDERDEALRDPVSVALATGRPSYIESDAVLVARDGRQRDIRSSAAPVRMPGGTITGAVLVFQDVTHSRALQKELAHSANHDPLTGLANRAAFERALEVALATSASGAEHVLCFVDLDNFKRINDTAGHAAGDELLRTAAETIKGKCRIGDVAARIGGDEFALLLANCTIEEGVAIARSVTRAIADIEFGSRGMHYRIGASIGVTAIGNRPTSLGFIGEADSACYAAKAAGRGTVVVYEGDSALRRRAGDAARPAPAEGQ